MPECGLQVYYETIDLTAALTLHLMCVWWAILSLNTAGVLRDHRPHRRHAGRSGHLARHRGIGGRRLVLAGKGLTVV